MLVLVTLSLLIYMPDPQHDHHYLLMEGVPEPPDLGAGAQGGGCRLQAE